MSPLEAMMSKVHKRLTVVQPPRPEDLIPRDLVPRAIRNYQSLPHIEVSQDLLIVLQENELMNLGNGLKMAGSYENEDGAYVYHYRYPQEIVWMFKEDFDKDYRLALEIYKVDRAYLLARVEVLDSIFRASGRI